MLSTGWQRPKATSNVYANLPTRCCRLLEAGNVERQFLHISVQKSTNINTQTHYQLHIACSKHRFGEQRVAAGDTWRRTRNMSGGSSHLQEVRGRTVTFTSVLLVHISMPFAPFFHVEASRTLSKTVYLNTKILWGATASTYWKCGTERMLWQRRTLNPY